MRNDEIFQTAPQQSYNLSVQGGNEKIKYAVSGEYTSQEGIIVSNKFQRFSARVIWTQNCPTVFL